MSNLVLKDITVSYGGSPALDHVNLAAKSGECIVIAGPSGSGKTTLLRAAAGLQKIKEGTVIIDGKNATAFPAAKRNMAMIFQDAALFPHTDAEGNISYGLHAAGYSADRIHDMVSRAAEKLHIRHLLKRYPSTLSAGERQRVGIARAIVRNPDILLLDEPFANLDPALRAELQSEIRRIQKESGMTMLIVTHDENEALMMADRIMLLRKGKCVETGTPEQISTDPRNLFTASFFSVLSCPVLQCLCRGGRLTVMGESFPVFLPDGTYQALLKPASVRGGGRWQGKVTACWKHEDRWALQCSVHGNEISLLWNRCMTAGDRISFDVRDGGFLLFDANGGRVTVNLP